MKMENKIELKQKLGLVPWVLLEAELLQLPILELRQKIQAELEENPVLEEQPKDEISLEIEDSGDSKMDDYKELSGDPRLPLSTEKEDDEDRELTWEAPQVSFWQRIEAQLNVFFAYTPKDKKIAEVIVDSLDGLGYLSKKIEKIAEELGVETSEVERVRQQILRGFDPVGVAATSLRELLSVQLEDLGLTHSIAYEIVKEHWEILEKKGIDGLVNELNLGEEKKGELVNILKSLYSAPQDKYVEERSEYVYPEVLFKIIENEIVVELNEWQIPSIQISSYYLDILSQKGCPRETKQFLRAKVKRALDFLRAIENRRQNILKVAEFIAKHNEDFLRGKTKFLKPVTQTEAASLLEIPISTFNRVVKGRYADTPVGIFELRFFFTKGVNKSGEQVPQHYLKEAIKKIISSEDPHHPYSDQEISDLLKKDGFTIARRTVAEYRKEMGIKKSSQRKYSPKSKNK